MTANGSGDRPNPAGSQAPADQLGLVGQAAVDALVALLDLEELGPDMFLGVSPPVGPQRVFGGQVAGQALVAAGRTVDPARAVHSLHGYFVRPGDPTEPITYSVERVRDGRSFSVRRSVATQHNKTIFFMSASFHVPEEGLDHQAPAPRVVPGAPTGDTAEPGAVDDRSVPPPEELPSLVERLAQYPERAATLAMRDVPIDVRYVNEPGWGRPGSRRAAPHQRVWMRIDGALPDDPLLHACALTFASDLTLLDSVLATHGEVWGPGGMIGASLDHAMWFHRPFRADEWLLYDCWSPSASDARGLATGRLQTPDGRHVASAVQEGLLRRVGG